MYSNELPPTPERRLPFPSSSESPSKPKRMQVKNACVNCQKACKKCDPGRPCQRCIKYKLGDTCVDSKRKPRKKGIKRGPYKKRKKALSDGRASTASARARSSSNMSAINFPDDSVLGPGAIPILHTNRPPTHQHPSLVGNEMSSSLDSTAVSPQTPQFGTPGDSRHPIHLSPISSAADGAYGHGGSGSGEHFRLPPIESFDHAPSPRPPMTSTHHFRTSSSPLNMLSDVALTSTATTSATSQDSTPLAKEPPIIAQHTPIPQSNSRFETFPSKFIPMSTARFDYTYRVPPRMHDGDESYTPSPWGSPMPVSFRHGDHRFDRTAGYSFGMEQERLQSSSGTEAQVRRLSQLLNKTHLDQQSGFDSDADSHGQQMRHQRNQNGQTWQDDGLR
ncbi:hypothetical protein EC988_000575, partial [Linderina pennispora]